MKDCIELIKNNATNYPERIAVIDGDRKISYADFLSLVNDISDCLTVDCSNPKVVIDLKQGIESYALIIATLNVAGTYCPLNPSAPIDRKIQIINDFAPDLIIVENRNEFNSEKFVLISELLKKSVTQNKVEAPFGSEDIIYIIYTSGSTGIPKGVKICRKALNKFLEWSIPTYGANENDIWGQFSYLSFDLRIVDIFTCLCSGATLLSMSDMTSKIGPSSVIQKHRISVWHSVPSAVDFMIEREKTKPIDFSSLKVMTFCGEPLRKYHLDFLFDKNPNMSIYNTYGPTEGTLFCSWQKFEKDNYENFCNPTLSIGDPIPGWNFKLREVENDSQAFEIIIYGEFIGKGYLGSVANSMFIDEEVEGTETNTFRTGDIVIKKDGHLYFSSRIDRQIKLSGHRIEPDEIDLKINQYLNKQSVTILHENFLYSFIESKEDFDVNQLKKFLSEKIEPYKIPREFIKIEKFPRSSNAKINYNELPNFIKNE